MKNVVRLAIVDPNDQTRTQIKNLALGLETVWLEAECSRYEFFTDVIMQTQPDLALISLDSDPDRALALLAKITTEVPSCNVIVISNSQEGSLILQSMRNGAKEFMNFPLKLDDFIAALERIKTTTGGPQKDGKVRTSEVITVAGVSGGIGCTSLATNLACTLAQNEENSVALIDLDLALGDADVWLDIIPDYTIQDVAENITRLDFALLKRSLTKHSCGLFLLPRPIHLEDGLPITADQMRRVIALLKATFSHLVIDISKNYSPLDLSVIDVSNTVLLMTQLDLPCLRNVIRVLQFLEQRDGMREKIKVVVNRQGLDDQHISLNKALETIGRDVFWQLPNDYANMVEARNNGVPLITQAPRAKLTRSIEQLSKAITHQTVPTTEEPDPKAKPKKRLFGMFGS
jgi:pilus assembly protein CpaE